MIILAIIGIVIFLGILVGLCENAKSRAELNKELQELEDRDKQLRTKPPYKVGQLYYRDHFDNGMVVSTNGNKGRYVKFMFDYDWDRADKICKKFAIEIPYQKNSKEEMERCVKWNKETCVREIPTIEELETLGSFYDTFIRLGKDYTGDFLKDIRNQQYSEAIFSQTLTDDGRSFYMYDLKQRRKYTLPIEDLKYRDCLILNVHPIIN